MVCPGVRDATLRFSREEQKVLRIGERAPEFSLVDDSGQTFTLSESLLSGPIVLYFYPKDDTPG